MATPKLLCQCTGCFPKLGAQPGRCLAYAPAQDAHAGLEVVRQVLRLMEDGLTPSAELYAQYSAIPQWRVRALEVLIAQEREK